MTKEDLLIDIHQAILNRKRVYIIMYCKDTDEFDVVANSDESTDFPSILSELPFTGRVYKEDIFPKWYEFVENVEETDIYGFELEDGCVQVAITPYDSIDKELEMTSGQYV